MLDDALHVRGREVQSIVQVAVAANIIESVILVRPRQVLPIDNRRPGVCPANILTLLSPAALTADKAANDPCARIVPISINLTDNVLAFCRAVGVIDSVVSFAKLNAIPQYAAHVTSVPERRHVRRIEYDKAR